MKITITMCSLLSTYITYSVYISAMNNSQMIPFQGTIESLKCGLVYSQNNVLFFFFKSISILVNYSILKSKFEVSNEIGIFNQVQSMLEVAVTSPSDITSKVMWGRELDFICDRPYLSFTKHILQEGNARLVSGSCGIWVTSRSL